MAVPVVSAVTPAAATVVCALVQALARLGVRQAFGVSGGALAAAWDAFSKSDIQVCHFRHESGAAFAAAEASHASARPVAAFCTTGPGLVNALTGLMAARDVGARVVLVSAYTSAGARGRYAIQETSTRTMPGELHAPGVLFDMATVIEEPLSLAAALQALARGLAGQGGFIAHLSIPTAVQAMPAIPFDLPCPCGRGQMPAPPLPDGCVRALAEDRFAVWIGAGAAGARAEILALLERTGAPVFCTPRAKGIVPETHPQFAGVTGMGGHESVFLALGELTPARILVLGSRLGEASTSWDPRYAACKGLVHVDLDAGVFGLAYPELPCMGVVADIGAFLRRVIPELPRRTGDAGRVPRPSFAAAGVASGRVRPEALMDALQRGVVDASDAIVLAESGNAFVWTTHRLRFAEAGRYRVSTGFGAMGHASAGVVGAALATGRHAVAVVGDGALLMQNEINTAAKYQARAVWIVLNDARYGMCAQGMETLGLSADASFPEVDFVAFARSLGADGVRVRDESELDPAIRRAMRSSTPFVVDVLVDLDARPPAGSRNRALARQLAETSPGLSFPPR